MKTFNQFLSEEINFDQVKNRLTAPVGLETRKNRPPEYNEVKDYLENNHSIDDDLIWSHHDNPHGHVLSPLFEYTGNSSHISDAIHGNNFDHRALDNAEKIDGLIKHHGKPLKRELHVYSGIRYKVDSEPGQTVHTKSFTSTSADPKVARSFATSNDSIPTILHFQLPKGYKKGLYISNLSHSHYAENEMEFLLNKNQKWKHIRTEDVQLPNSKGKMLTLIPSDDN